ncbi:unnamed protein product [Effrenium voratum]|nr:unnamed protein product [Effrenium voratum]
MDVVVVATFQDFDETLEKRLRGPGSGRTASTRAMLRHLPQESVRKVDLLILDWKAPPKQGPKELSVSLNEPSPMAAVWGSREQLLTKFPASVWDLCICCSTLRLAMDVGALLKVKRRVAIVHDYNLPFGPWGSLCEAFELFCASQHLADFVEKWAVGCRALCAYSADYGFFEPLPAGFEVTEGKHSFVTFVSPCPEKGLSIFLRLAQQLPDVQFLAVKTTTWSKPWHEQVLKKLKNVKIQAASEKIDDILKVTKVLLAPSVYPDAFGLVCTEAQLRGIPVVSTAVAGLAEANSVPSTRVADVPIVLDPRTHELVMGMTLEEAESSLAIDRPGQLTMEQWRQTAITQENYQKVAEESDVQKLLEVLLRVLGDLRQASQDAKIAATGFVERRRGQFMASLKKLLDEHVAAGDAKPAAVQNAAGTVAAGKFAPKPRAINAQEVENDFDVNQDFTQVPDFDGTALAAKCLVRLCEQGNLTVAAELLQAKADVNLPEPEVGVTPLIAAANCGHLDVCKYLLRKNAEVSCEVHDGTRRTALHAAAHMGYASVVQLLLDKGAQARAVDLTQTHPLHLAVRNGHAGAAELLLKGKANPNMADEQGHVAINDAVAKDRFDLVTKLLEYGALVNVRNMAGLEAISFSRTPHMQSIIMKHDVNF